ncbi:MAG: DUF1931 family protein [Epsilonproteobacteria bacterium]|nr:DUF1931 family protein [Campylobacterota bacterium]
MAVVGFTKLEALFRKAASLDIHKEHAKEIVDFVGKKVYDLLLAAELSASMNNRDIILESDLPITKGLQETIIEFRKLEEELPIEDILEQLTHYPVLKYALSPEVEANLPEITGTMLVVMAKVMKHINEDSRHVTAELIEKSKDILDLTL